LWCRYLSWVSGWTEASEENNVETAPSPKTKRKIEQMAKAAWKVKMLEVPSGTNVAHIYIQYIWHIYIVQHCCNIVNMNVMVQVLM
jgi:hypothetical protein